MTNKQLICPFCGLGCAVTLKIDEFGRPYAVDAFEGDHVSKGKACPKPFSIPSFLNSSNRLAHPMKRKENGFVEISWGDAIKEISERIKEITKSDDPSSLGFLGSANCTNEDNYVFQKFARAIGTNNIDHHASFFALSEINAMYKSLGIPSLSSTYEELLKSSVVLIWGFNPAETNPVLMGQYILKAKEKGAKVVVVDPRKTKTAWFSDIHLMLNPKTDYALALSLLNVIFNEKLYDKNYSERINLSQKSIEVINSYSPEVVEKICGIQANTIRQVAKLIATSGKASILWGLGILQQINGEDIIEALLTISALCGYLGKEGCVVGGIKNEVNLQGASDMGVLPNFLPGYIDVSNKNEIEKFSKIWGFYVPDKEGMNAFEMLYSSNSTKIKGLYIMGMNPLVLLPNMNLTKKILENLDFLVVQDSFFTETAEFADIILPAATLPEKDGTVTNFERRVRWNNKAVEPVGEAKPDWMIVREIAKELGFESFFSFNSTEEVTREISSVNPLYSNITPEKLKENTSGIFWNINTNDKNEEKFLFLKGFYTPSGKFELQLNETFEIEKQSANLPFLLITFEYAGQHGAATLTRNFSPLMKRWGEAIGELNVETAKSLGINEGDKVKIKTEYGEFSCKVHLTQNIVKDVIAVPWHFGANSIFSCEIAKKYRKPELKVFPCSIIIQGEKQ
ncbi:molybdopterin-dependent oxidoreductase [Fervidicoccus fontis]|uniref:Molybdopterin-dependent oxidoreductase n=1 Tax=Fervidicoccus fontis TaxID=683846 RepID=A0A843A5U0_9CREN|nr:molybdopterin-dependent oxidoreductase [Fervidicoccus fontis]MBE9390658.1 molybdopterin-dependent oxidoreductase [Fervidicoccus fontis]